MNENTTEVTTPVTSEWVAKILEENTLAQLQDHAKTLGIKNIKKFTKVGLAIEIENVIDADKETDMNETTTDTDLVEEIVELLEPVTVEITPIVGDAEEIIGLLEDSVADIPGENETEVAPKLTDEYKTMLDAVRENAAKRKHVMWNTIIAQAENEVLAQIAGKANTVRGILWKVGKHLQPLIEAYDVAEAAKAAQAAEQAEIDAALEAEIAAEADAAHAIVEEIMSA